MAYSRALCRNVASTVVRGTKRLFLRTSALAAGSMLISFWYIGTGVAPGQAQSDCSTAGQSRLRAEEVGINVNNLSFSAVADPRLIQALRQSGARWIRINLYWGWLQQTPDRIDWTSVDRGLAALTGAHISTLITLNGPVPCWALDSAHAMNCTSPQQVMTQSAVIPWVQFVSTAVRRYSNQVHYWEIWNEPDLFSSIEEVNPTQRLLDYRNRILRPGAEAVHRADPSARVVAPGFAAIPSGSSASGQELQSAFRLILADDVASDVNIVSLHSYYPSSATTKLMSAHTILRGLGLSDRPLWVTELGVSGGMLQGADTEQRKAELLVEETARVLKLRMADKVFVFALTDTPTPSGNHADDYGLISNEDYRSYKWHPKPAYLSLQHWIRTGCR